jgi:hypothetical protein
MNRGVDVVGDTAGVPDDQLPPGWPVAVRPPGSPDWERSAVGWLLDLCPSEYRAHPALTTRPLALSWLAGRHVVAQGQANTAARAAARDELRDRVDAAALERVLEVLEHEHARLRAAYRAVGLVDEALQGRRYVPRL